MPRDTLDRKIHQLEDELFVLSSMVEQAILSAVETLRRQDGIAARQIFQGDRLINERRYAIENAIIILIATQQPAARDLRRMTAMLEIINELERIGDYAKGIAKVVILQGEESFSIEVDAFPAMADQAVDMLQRGLKAFVAQNAQEAVLIACEDDQVDRQYIQIHTQLIHTMIADPSKIDEASHLMWVAHNLERMADRVTNICERTVFISTGDIIELDQEDEEEAIEV
jgi:phosphate transport system protein